MSLISTISLCCPNGVSHDHSINHNPTKEFPDGCIFCEEKPERYEFNHICKDYFSKTIIILNPQQLNILDKIFSTDLFFLPFEIRNIIYEKSTYVKYNINEIHLDEDGINHMMKCLKCSRSFMNYVNNNACPNHILPRISYGNRYDINF